MRRNGRVTFSQRTMFAHWLMRTGRSRQEPTHFANVEQMIASDVGRIASGSSSSAPPPIVTHAHSGEKPSTCSFSCSSRLFGTNSGKYALTWPVSLMRRSMSRCMCSHTA